MQTDDPILLFFFFRKIYITLFNSICYVHFLLISNGNINTCSSFGSAVQRPLDHPMQYHSLQLTKKKKKNLYRTAAQQIKSNKHPLEGGTSTRWILA